MYDWQVEWCKSCALSRDILQLLALWELKDGAPCSTTPPGCRICSSGGHENSIQNKAQSRYCTQIHCSMTFYPCLSLKSSVLSCSLSFMSFHILLPFIRVLGSKGATGRCHKLVPQNRKKSIKIIKHLISRVVTWPSTVMQDVQHVYNDVDILWTSTLNVSHGGKKAMLLGIRQCQSPPWHFWVQWQTESTWCSKGVQNDPADFKKRSCFALVPWLLEDLKQTPLRPPSTKNKWTNNGHWSKDVQGCPWSNSAVIKKNSARFGKPLLRA